MEALRELYYSPSTGLASATALYQRAKAAGLQVTKAQVSSFVKEQETDQVFLRRKVKTHFPLVAHRLYGRLQLDLADISTLSRWNQGTHFLFCCIDVYSRFAWVLPLKSKGNAAVLGAFKTIIKQIKALDHFPPSQVDSDREASMMSRDYQAYCADNLITQKFLAVEDYKGTAVVDRFIRTLRELLNRYMVAHNTKSYLPALQDLVQNYNTRTNQGIRSTPVNALNDPNHETRYRGLVSKQIMKAKLAATKGDYQGHKVGDRVRVLLRKTFFEKGTTKNWSSSIHTVESFRDGVYFATGRVGGYKVYELQAVRAVQYLPVANPEAVAAVEAEAKEDEIDRRIDRRVQREGIERAPPEVVQAIDRPVRNRRQRDLGPYLSQ